MSYIERTAKKLLPILEEVKKRMNDLGYRALIRHDIEVNKEAVIVDFLEFTPGRPIVIGSQAAQVVRFSSEPIKRSATGENVVYKQIKPAQSPNITKPIQLILRDEYTFEDSSRTPIRCFARR